MSANPIVIVTSVGTEQQANLIARELVARRHAGCVNIIPSVRSIYRWKGRICHDSEYLLIVKSMAEEFEAVRAAIRELHTYELPEILSFAVSQGDQSFIGWIQAALDKHADFADDDEDDEQ